jgi:two-component system, OmpR family, phosphate regulon sensor histidine kinase PhoR
MNRTTIQWVIVASVVALLGVVVNQFFWVKKNVEVQSNLVEIQKLNLKIEEEKFNSTVTLALLKVRDNLVSLNKAASEIYLDPVKQITSSYFVVSFYEPINPNLLEPLLIKEFEEQNIYEPFEYGLYDCFTDSIIFDKFVDLSNKVVKEQISQTLEEKWEHDGYYFGVYFPNKSYQDLQPSSVVSYSLLISSSIIILVIAVLAYVINIIVKQKRLSEVKTDFINNMTHELKTPISTIALSSDFISKAKDTTSLEKIHHYANIIKTENKRLENQVERVLQLAKLDKEKVELKLSEMQLDTLIREVVDIFELTIKNRAGSILFVNEANNTSVFADRLHITNVVYNLLDNANKYTEEAPEILVTLSNKNNGILVEVKDNGKGLTEEDKKQVFEKFFRVTMGDVHDVKGFGLGLYYVKTIAEAHLGKIGVESKIGKGSIFWMWLPQTQNSSF